MPGTFSEDYPEEYGYFRDLLAFGLLTGEAEAEDVPVLRKALDRLADRRVVSKCGCGAAGCRTFRFEHSGGAGLSHPIDIPGAPVNVILFHNDDGETTEIEQYPND